MVGGRVFVSPHNQITSCVSFVRHLFILLPHFFPPIAIYTAALQQQQVLPQIPCWLVANPSCLHRSAVLTHGIFSHTHPCHNGGWCESYDSQLFFLLRYVVTLSRCHPKIASRVRHKLHIHRCPSAHVPVLYVRLAVSTLFPSLLKPTALQKKKNGFCPSSVGEISVFSLLVVTYHITHHTQPTAPHRPPHIHTHTHTLGLGPSLFPTHPDSVPHLSTASFYRRASPSLLLPFRATTTIKSCLTKVRNFNG